MFSVTRMTVSPSTGRLLGSARTEPATTEIPWPNTLKFASVNVASRPAPKNTRSTGLPEATSTGPAADGKLRISPAPPAAPNAAYWNCRLVDPALTAMLAAAVVPAVTSTGVGAATPPSIAAWNLVAAFACACVKETLPGCTMPKGSAYTRYDPGGTCSEKVPSTAPSPPSTAPLPASKTVIKG